MPPQKRPQCSQSSITQIWVQLKASGLIRSAAHPIAQRMQTVFFFQPHPIPGEELQILLEPVRNDRNSREHVETAFDLLALDAREVRTKRCRKQVFDTPALTLRVGLLE